MLKANQIRLAVGALAIASLIFGAVMIMNPNAEAFQVSTKRISLNPYAALLDGEAHFTTSAFNGPIRLPGNGAAPSFALGFSVPNDYVVGSPLTVEILWETRQTECFVIFAANALFRAGTGKSADGGLATGGLTPLDGSTQNLVDNITGTSMQVAASSVAQQTELVRFQISSTADEFSSLEPGDAVNFSIFRDDANIEDTCANGIGIAGLSVSYEAQL